MHLSVREVHHDKFNFLIKELTDDENFSMTKNLQKVFIRKVIK